MNVISSVGIIEDMVDALLRCWDASCNGWEMGAPTFTFSLKMMGLLKSYEMVTMVLVVCRNESFPF